MLAIVIFALAGSASLASAALSSGCASIDPDTRKECGYPGISAADCIKNTDCCYDESIPNVKWCFLDTSKTPCSSSPCLNGGNCTVSGSSYTCQCAAGFSGPTCAVTPCSSSPCLNGGNCTVSGSSYTCKCAAGFSGPTCAVSRPYTLNITVDDNIKELYFDGVKYTGSMPYAGSYNVKDSANLPARPSVIAVSGYDGGGLYGMLASDSEGFLTDGSWKCTHLLFDNWFAAKYDDSAWPAAQVLYANGNRTSDVNKNYLSNGLVNDVSHRAKWIWSPIFNSTTRMAYCRFRLPAVDPCMSAPCKNGGTCQPYNNAARFWCQCPAGFTGYDCSQKPVDYQFSVTADDCIRDVYVDGRWYDVPMELNWDRNGTLSLDYMPSVIAVSGSNSPVALFGILGSDNAGRITDDSWKCSNVYYTEWMLPDFDDSKWDTANLGSINGDRMSPINDGYHSRNPIDGISNAAYWIWPKVYDVNSNFAYCRVKLSLTGNACISSPCKNGGTCTNVGPTFTCSCPAGTSGDKCKIPGATYQLNITGDDYLRDLYIDGIHYDTPNGGGWSTKDTIQVDFLPSVIGVYVQLTGAMFGVLASDSAGFVTDASWKCTKRLSNNWMFLGYNDSAWPAPLVQDINGNRSSDINRLWHGWVPIENIDERAQWIWAADYNTTEAYNWVYCRLVIPASGNACYSNPCKNGGTCTNKRTTFECACKSGFSGAQCTNPSTTYQLNVTADDYIYSLYIDGIKYDLPYWNVWYLSGTINLNFVPKQISVYAWNDNNLYNGMLFSDSLGHLSGAGWKCTRYGFKDWMLPNYNDSAWSAASLVDKNSNAAINALNWNKPIAGISNDAYWIWPTDYNTAGSLNYAYCRSPLFY